MTASLSVLYIALRKPVLTYNEQTFLSFQRAIEKEEKDGASVSERPKMLRTRHCALEEDPACAVSPAFTPLRHWSFIQAKMKIEEARRLG